jgi:hypothetical protein
MAPSKTGAEIIELQAFREGAQSQFEATGQAVVDIPERDLGGHSRGQTTRARLIEAAAGLGYRIVTRRIRNPITDGVQTWSMAAYVVGTTEEKVETCKFCGHHCRASTAHRHDGGWVGDECCWDERLRSTE